MANELALIKRDVVDVVGKKVQEFVSRGELHLPPNYSVENAMKSAWLILQNTFDKDKRPVLQNCTRDSIANALLDMAVQGLNPAKKQGYFIAYGRQLVFQRSYFGTMAITKRVAGAKDIFAELVYKGDEFEYSNSSPLYTSSANISFAPATRLVIAMVPKYDRWNTSCLPYAMKYPCFFAGFNPCTAISRSAFAILSRVQFCSTGLLSLSNVFWSISHADFMAFSTE